MKKNEKIIIIILIIITLIAIGIKVIISNKKDTKTQNKETEIITNIDPNDSAYEGKNIYEKDGDTIIEEENEGKTIQTTKTLEETDLVKATDETKQKYLITDVEVKKSGAKTKITGNIKNNEQKAHKISVQARFYDSDKKVKGSGNIVINEIKAGETQKFTIEVLGDLTQYTCEVNVEFTN